MVRTNRKTIKGTPREKAFLGALIGFAGNIIGGAMQQQTAAMQAAAQVESANIAAKSAQDTANANAAMQTANNNFQLSTMKENRLVDSMAQLNNMIANDNASINSLARQNRIAYRCGGKVGRKKLAHGISAFPLRGSSNGIVVENGGHLENAGVASNGAPVVEFKGRSHRHGGINVNVGGTPVNVQGNELATQTSDGQVLIVPNVKVGGIDFKQALENGATPDEVATKLDLVKMGNPKYKTQYTNDSRSKALYGWDNSNWWNLGGNLANMGLGVHNYLTGNKIANNTYTSLKNIYNSVTPALVDYSDLMENQRENFAPTFAALQTARVGTGAQQGALSREYTQARREVNQGTNSNAARFDRFNQLRDAYGLQSNKIEEEAANKINAINQENARLATQANTESSKAWNQYLGQTSDMVLRSRLADQAAINDINKFKAEGLASTENWYGATRATNANTLFNTVQNGITDIANYYNDNRNAKIQNSVNLLSALGQADKETLDRLGISNYNYGDISSLMKVLGLSKNTRTRSKRNVGNSLYSASPATKPSTSSSKNIDALIRLINPDMYQ